MQPKLVFAILIILVAFGGGVMLANQQNPRQSDVNIPGFLWPDPPTIDSFVLSNSDGSEFTEAQMAEHWTLVVFGFTNCPDICPTTMATLNQLHEKLIEDPRLSEDLQVVFVSVDPERDSHEILGDYVHYFDSSFVGVTGDDESLRRFAKQFSTLFMKVDTAGVPGYSMNHSASVLLVDPALRFVSVFSLPHEIEDMRERLLQIVTFIEAAG